MRPFPILLALGILVMGPASSRGDYVLTDDGSKIVGRIKQWADGKLIIESNVAGTITIDAARVVAVKTDESVNVQLESGDRLVGPVEVSTEVESTSVVQSSVGAIPVATSGITGVWREGELGPESLAARAEIAKYKPRWITLLEAGFSQAEGNTNNKTIRGRLDVNRITDQDRLKFYLSADYGEENRVRTRSEYIAGVRYEHQFNDRWYWYARGELENDEFENLRLRATAAGGVGRFWLRKPEHEFKTRFGAGYRHETFRDDTSNDDAIVDLGWDYRLDVNKWMQFTQSTTYSPSMEQLRRYRLELDTAFLFPLKADQWKLKLGTRNTYNSHPAPGRVRLDNLYYANIVLELKPE